jgi:Na+-driven multidrug efflux pump
MAAGTLGCLVASEPLMRLFTSTPETVEAGKVALRIICLGFVVSAISTTSSGALEGLGKGTQSLVISLCRYIVFIMLLAWVLCRQFGPVGVWNAFWATEVLSAIVSLIVYKKSV